MAGRASENSRENPELRFCPLIYWYYTRDIPYSVPHRLSLMIYLLVTHCSNDKCCKMMLDSFIMFIMYTPSSAICQFTRTMTWRNFAGWLWTQNYYFTVLSMDLMRNAVYILIHDYGWHDNKMDGMVSLWVLWHWLLDISSSPELWRQSHLWKMPRGSILRPDGTADQLNLSTFMFDMVEYITGVKKSSWKKLPIPHCLNSTQMYISSKSYFSLWYIVFLLVLETLLQSFSRFCHFRQLNSWDLCDFCQDFSYFPFMKIKIRTFMKSDHFIYFVKKFGLLTNNTKWRITKVWHFPCIERQKLLPVVCCISHCRLNPIKANWFENNMPVHYKISGIAAWCAIILESDNEIVQLIVKTVSNFSTVLHNCMFIQHLVFDSLKMHS
jgi:hypothetical protein